MALVSIDVGTKNFGLFVCDKKFSPLVLENLDLRPYTSDRLKKMLDHHLTDLEVDLIIIEKQLEKNKIACYVSCHLEMYFCIKYPDASLRFVSPKLKGIKTVSSYKERKNLAVERMKKFFSEDDKTMSKINSLKKQDDIADAVCQLFAYFNI
nr:MAG: hypothetical protein DiTV3a_F2ORF3 [Diabrotica toursvirus 3a]